MRSHSPGRGRRKTVEKFTSRSPTGRTFTTWWATRISLCGVGTALCSAKTPSGYGETLIFLWPNLRKSPLKVVVDQQASVVVGFQPVVEVDLVQIGRYQFFAEFVSFRT